MNRQWDNLESSAESSKFTFQQGSPVLGTVIAVQANFYQVKQDLISPDKNLLCTRRTRLKKIGQKIMVGDRVVVEEADRVAQRGVISQVIPRISELQRPPIANANQILLVFAVAEPSLDPWQLSRFLVKAESTSLNLSLCLNKCDLISVEAQHRWRHKLSQWGYEVNLISIRHKMGIEKLQKYLEEKTSIVAGPSGVGKSSLIDTLIPAIDLRIGKVSGKLKRGRHTTRHVELFELPGGGLLADSPGFNQLDLGSLPQDLVHYFPEARARLKQDKCQFADCIHRDEPNCAVRGNWERYEHYLDFLAEAIAYQETLQQQPDQESNLKLKIKKSGKSQYEPKLKTKKYRRTSRKSKQQNLRDIYDKQLNEEINDKSY